MKAMRFQPGVVHAPNARRKTYKVRLASTLAPPHHPIPGSWSQRANPSVSSLLASAFARLPHDKRASRDAGDRHRRTVAPPYQIFWYHFFSVATAGLGTK